MLHTYCLRQSLLAIAFLALAGCASLNGAGDKVAKAATPYRMDVIQGNVITREQVAFLKLGMPRQQVRDVLGTPLLASVFHEDRWDYVFTLASQRSEPQTRKVTVFFKGDVLERIQADALPSESEFVATLKSQPKEGPLPALEASAKGLSKFPSATPVTTEPAALPPAPSYYPPLEPAGK